MARLGAADCWLRMRVAHLCICCATSGTSQQWSARGAVPPLSSRHPRFGRPQASVLRKLDAKDSSRKSQDCPHQRDCFPTEEEEAGAASVLPDWQTNGPYRTARATLVWRRQHLRLLTLLCRFALAPRSCGNRTDARKGRANGLAVNSEPAWVSPRGREARTVLRGARPGEPECPLPYIPAVGQVPAADGPALLPSPGRSTPSSARRLLPLPDSKVSRCCAGRTL
jgi:hypothetical protein